MNFLARSLKKGHSYESDIPKSEFTHQILLEIKHVKQMYQSKQRIYHIKAILMISVKCTPDGRSNVPLMADQNKN